MGFNCRVSNPMIDAAAYVAHNHVYLPPWHLVGRSSRPCFTPVLDIEKAGEDLSQAIEVFFPSNSFSAVQKKHAYNPIQTILTALRLSTAHRLRMAAPPPPPHLNVKRGARDRLWNPNAGIRFAPKPDVEIVYPKLDTGRLGHAADSKRQAVEGDEYLSDVEEFERFAAEWYDQQDDLAAQKRPPKPIHEQVSAVVGINPEYAATPVVFGQKNEPPVAEKQVKKPVVLREPPVSACDFKISKELFEAALKSKPESAGSFWSHTMYSKPEPDGPAQKVKVHYCASKTTMEWVCNKYFQGEPVLGFDLEWCTAPSKRAGIRDNVSLIQLASPSRIALFHVAIFPKDDFNFPSFKQIMENEDVVKVGVAIRGDCTRLNQHTKITGKGLIELSHLYKLVKYSKERRFELINRSLVSLAQQTQEYLGIPLYKGKDVRISDWSRHLTNSQIHCKSLYDDFLMIMMF